MGALSQQLALRLMDRLMPYWSANLLNSSLQYCMPRSEWKINPSSGCRICYFQGICHQTGLHLGAHAPTDHPLTEQVQYNGQKYQLVMSSFAILGQPYSCRTSACMALIWTSKASSLRRLRPVILFAAALFFLLWFWKYPLALKPRTSHAKAIGH